MSSINASNNARTPVVIQECGSYDIEPVMAKVNAAVDLLGGWERFVKPHDTVLLKVNLIGPKTSESASVTHSAFVRALVRILKGRGCTVWIGDSSGGAIAGIAPTGRSFKVAGYEQVAAEEGAEIKNFDSEGIVPIKPESGLEETMYLAKPLFDADVVINLPKLKTHSAAVYTGAVKNVFGCVPGLRKAIYHRMAPTSGQLGEHIADIHKACIFRLHIMDGILAMQGEGPTAGSPYPAGKILVSEDPLALDTVAAAMLGLKVADVPILQVASNRRVGNGDLGAIDLLGDHAAAIPRLERFRLPRATRSVKTKNGQALVKVVDFFSTRPIINLRKCRNCDTCVDSCPMQAIDRQTKQINYNACIKCMCCHELCMFKAVELKADNPVAGLITKFYRQ